MVKTIYCKILEMQKLSFFIKTFKYIYQNLNHSFYFFLFFLLFLTKEFQED